MAPRRALRGTRIRLQVQRGVSLAGCGPAAPLAAASTPAALLALAVARPARRRAGHRAGVDLERAARLGVLPLPDRGPDGARPRALSLEPARPGGFAAGAGASPSALGLGAGGGARDATDLPRSARARGALSRRLLARSRRGAAGGQPGRGGEAQLALPAVGGRCALGSSALRA